MACMSQSGSHCCLLIIPMMVVFGMGIVLGASWARPDLIMPVLLPSMLVLFVAFTLYYYFRGVHGVWRVRRTRESLLGGVPSLRVDAGA